MLSIHNHTGKSVDFLSLGCFIDIKDTSTFSSLETVNATYLDGPFNTRKNAVLKCALESAKMDYKAFAVFDGGACYSGPFAHFNYSIYNATSCPTGGEGGLLVSEVYLLGGEFYGHYIMVVNCKYWKWLLFPFLTDNQTDLKKLILCKLRPIAHFTFAHAFT